MKVQTNRTKALNYLCHHGVEGQKWGVKHGPPYPLDAKKHKAIVKNGDDKKTYKATKKYYKESGKVGRIVGRVLGTAAGGVGGYLLGKKLTKDSDLLKRGAATAVGMKFGSDVSKAVGRGVSRKMDQHSEFGKDMQELGFEQDRAERNGGVYKRFVKGQDGKATYIQIRKFSKDPYEKNILKEKGYVSRDEHIGLVKSFTDDFDNSIKAIKKQLSSKQKTEKVKKDIDRLSPVAIDIHAATGTGSITFHDKKNNTLVSASIDSFGNVSQLIDQASRQDYGSKEFNDYWKMRNSNVMGVTYRRIDGAFRNMYGS